MELSHQHVVRGSFAFLTVTTSDLIHQGMESCPCPCCGLHDRYEALRVDSFDCPGKVVYRTMKKMF